MRIPEDIEKTLPITIEYFEYDLGTWGKARIQRWPLMDSIPNYTPVIMHWDEIFEAQPFKLQTQDNGTT